MIPPKCSLRKLLFVVAVCGAVCALWFAPAKFTFELKSEHRTSCGVGDQVDILTFDQTGGLRVLVKNTLVMAVDRIRNGDEPVDKLTVRTSLFSKIRLSCYEDFSAVYYARN